LGLLEVHHCLCLSAIPRYPPLIRGLCQCLCACLKEAACPAAPLPRDFTTAPAELRAPQGRSWHLAVPLRPSLITVGIPVQEVSPPRNEGAFPVPGVVSRADCGKPLREG